MTDTILTVDDDRDVQEMLHLFLTAEGFKVLQAFDGEHCLQILENRMPDLVLLDIQMPGMDGITLCRKIRTLFDRPILFLTGNRLQENKLNSLQAGGDDYITKPFDHLELIARIHSHLRWGNLLAATKEQVNRLDFPGLEIDIERLTVTANQQPVILLSKEFHLLLTLVQKPRRVYHPRQLYDLIWSDSSEYSSDTIKVHIHRLRKKIEVDPSHPRYIHTIKGFGYKFEFI